MEQFKIQEGKKRTTPGQTGNVFHSVGQGIRTDLQEQESCNAK